MDVTIFLPRGGALLGFPAFFEGLRFFAQTFLYVLFGWGWEMSWFHWVREYGGEIGRVVCGVWYWVLRRLVLGFEVGDRRMGAFVFKANAMFLILDSSIEGI